MTVYLTVCLFSFFMVYLLIPLTKRLAIRYGVVDQPNQRKIHRNPIPLSGGLAIYFGTIVTLFLFFQTTSLHFVIAWGGLFLVGIGLIDDWFKSKGKEFPAWPKLIVQIAAAVFAYIFGIQFFGLGNFWTGQGIIYFPPWLAVFMTIIWIVGFINMINFLDGMDGLAGGITIISSLTLFLIAIMRSQFDVAILSIIIIGASLAFLRHNFHPASVFLGDAGSMFLGYIIGVTSLYGTMKGATFITFVVTILALGVPVFDTIQVIITRLKEGTPIYKPDKRHVHHRLLNNGLSQKQAVMVIYAMGIGFSVLSILLLLLVG
jgi:UDP-GlcNAc:undecaprenyl-phosphate GlcNAc-1-phosphate transferase